MEPTFTFNRDEARGWLEAAIDEDFTRLQEFTANFKYGSGVPELEELLYNLQGNDAIATEAPLLIALIHVNSEHESGFVQTVDFNYRRYDEIRHAGCYGVRDLYVETRKVLTEDEADNIELVLDTVEYIVSRANWLAPAALKLLEVMPRVETGS